jgi:DNA-binding protein WhiA
LQKVFLAKTKQKNNPARTKNMISITNKVKEELAALEPADATAGLAELSAILSAAGTLGICSIGYYVEAAGGPFLKRRVDYLLLKIYGVASDEGETARALKNQTSAFRVTGAVAERILEDCEILIRDGDGLIRLERGVAPYMVKDEDAARRYLAGAFMAAGSLNVPSGGAGYHLEMAASHGELADGWAKMTAAFGIPAKVLARHGKNVVYLKDNRLISDFLALVGAEQAVLDLADLAADKALHNTVNRRTNCEEANIDRMVDAAARQTEAVRKLQARGVLGTLPIGLRALAAARLKRPELGLAELGALMNPPLTKSGVNHRFERILAMAERSGSEN